MSIRLHVLLFASVVCVGCASPMTELRKDNRRLTDELAELRADRRGLDRKIHDLEHQLALARDGKTNDVSVPQLPIEVVTPPVAPRVATSIPSGGRIIGVADDGGQIIYEGDAALGKAATVDDDVPRRAVRPVTHTAVAIEDPLPSASDRIEVTHHVPLAARTTRGHVRADHDASAGSGDPAGDYRAGVDLVRTGKYDAGVTALRAFIARYPRHDYANNAQYWIGEAFYAQKDFVHALAEFRATIETYPRGNKVPDAMLKLGYCYQAMGEADKGRALLEQVVSMYPKSEPAALAGKRLESL
jgi:tol-pal system protein YbgF